MLPLLKQTTLYINTEAASPMYALVRSPTNLSPKELGSIIVGDTMNLVIIPIDSDGSTNAAAGSAQYRIKAAIGTLGSTPLALNNNNFYGSASLHWTGSINTNTGSLINAVTGDTLSTYLEIELTASGSLADSGSRYTILQAPLTVRNQILT